MDNKGFQKEDEHNYQTFTDPSQSSDEPRRRKSKTSPHAVQEERNLPLEVIQPTVEEAKPKELKKVELKRTIGFSSCVGLLVGSMIGSGIFISPIGVLKGSGSVGLTMIIWVLCGIFSFLGGLAFAELGTLIPSSGSHYIYLLEGFAPTRRKEKLFWGPLLAFLYNWQATFFTRPAGFAVQGMASASYILQLNAVGCLQGKDKLDERALKLVGAVILVIITTINCVSVRVTTRIINVFTVAKVLALVFVIISGVAMLAQGTNKALKTGFEGTDLNLNGIALAFFSGLWAYAGWGNLNMITREIKDPVKNMSRSIMISILFVIVIYVLTNISYFIVLSKDEFLASDAVAVDFGNNVVGYAGALFMVFSVACSIFGSTLGGGLTGGRISYAAAREGHLVDFLSFLHVRYMTPSPALLFSLVLSLMMLASSDILSLIFLSGFLDAIFNGLVMIVLIKLKRNKPKDYEGIQVPYVVPVLVLLFNVFLMVTPFVEDPKIESLYVLLMLFIGVVVYVPFVYWQWKLPFLDKFRQKIQILLEVSPPEDDLI